MKTKTYRTSDTVDFVIVGSGAAGGVLARELARARLDVVVLEQGPRLYPADFQHDELKNWFIGGLVDESAEQSAELPPFGLRNRRGAAGTHAAVVCARCRWQHVALHRQLLALPRDRFSRAQRTRRDFRHGFRRLADHVRGARALLHQGRLGDRRLRTGRSRSRRFAAQSSVSHAADAREILGRVVRARRAQARPAARAGAAGHQLGSLRRASRLRALRLLPRLRLRSHGQGFQCLDGHSGGGGHGQLRGAGRQLRVASRDRQARPRDGRGVLRRARATNISSTPARWSSRPTAARRRGCCSTPRTRASRRGWRIPADWSANT